MSYRNTYVRQNIQQNRVWMSRDCKNDRWLNRILCRKKTWVWGMEKWVNRNKWGGVHCGSDSVATSHPPNCCVITPPIPSPTAVLFPESHPGVGLPDAHYHPILTTILGSLQSLQASFSPSLPPFPPFFLSRPEAHGVSRPGIRS